MMHYYSNLLPAETKLIVLVEMEGVESVPAASVSAVTTTWNRVPTAKEANVAVRPVMVVNVVAVAATVAPVQAAPVLACSPVQVTSDATRIPGAPTLLMKFVPPTVTVVVVASAPVPKAAVAVATVGSGVAPVRRSMKHAILVWKSV